MRRQPSPSGCRSATARRRAEPAGALDAPTCTALFVERLGELGVAVARWSPRGGTPRGARSASSAERGWESVACAPEPHVGGHRRALDDRGARGARSGSARPTGRSPRPARSWSAAAPRCGAATRSCRRRSASSCRASRIVAGLGDVLRELPGDGPALPSAVSFISGPSGTADIAAVSRRRRARAGRGVRLGDRRGVGCDDWQRSTTRPEAHRHANRLQNVARGRRPGLRRRAGDLLDLVRTEGSLSKAASRLGMSYNKAWRTLHAAEQRLGFALLERRIGGEHGGGSQVSASGEELLARYDALRADVERDLERLYDKHFSDWPAGRRGRRRRKPSGMSAERDPSQHRAHGGSRSHNLPRRTGPSGPARRAGPCATSGRRSASGCRRTACNVRPGHLRAAPPRRTRGSLNQAAKDMGMSYSKAWRIMHEDRRAPRRATVRAPHRRARRRGLASDRRGPAPAAALRSFHARGRRRACRSCSTSISASCRPSPARPSPARPSPASAAARRRPSPAKGRRRRESRDRPRVRAIDPQPTRRGDRALTSARLRVGPARGERLQSRADCEAGRRAGAARRRRRPRRPRDGEARRRAEAVPGDAEG